MRVSSARTVSSSTRVRMLAVPESCSDVTVTPWVTRRLASLSSFSAIWRSMARMSFSSCAMPSRIGLRPSSATRSW